MLFEMIYSSKNCPDHPIEPMTNSINYQRGLEENEMQSLEMNYTEGELEHAT